MKSEINLLSLIQNELSSTEQVVDVKDKTRLRYALYARKSTESEDRQEKSIEQQIKDCYENIIDRYHIKIENSDIYTDKKSAKVSGKRTAFNEMMKAIRKGKYDGIIAWHYDRLARNMKEAGEIIDLIDSGDIVDLQLAKATFENSPNGKMILGINFVLSKHYSDHLSESVLRGNKGRTANGTILNHIIHGYRITDDRRIEPDGHNWDIIRMAFRMRIDESRSFRQIADFINKSGYEAYRISKSNYAYTFKVQDVARLLKDPIYAGIHVYGSQVVKLADVYDDFEPMISEDDYVSINQKTLLHSDFRYRASRSNRTNDVSNFLRSFVICKHCDHTMSTGVTTRKKGGVVINQSFRFRCENKGCEMRGKGPAGSLIRDYVIRFLKDNLIITEKQYQQYLADRASYIREQADILNSAKKSLEREVGQNERSYKNALANASDQSSAMSKHYTPDYLDELKKKWDTNKTQLKDTIEEIDKLKGVNTTLREFLELYENTGEILRLTTSMSLADEIIRIFFSNITIQASNDDKNSKQKQWSVIGHCLREPFDKLAGSNQNTTWSG